MTAEEALQQDGTIRALEEGLKTIIFTVDNIVSLNYGIDFYVDQVETEKIDPSASPTTAGLDNQSFNFAVSWRSYQRIRTVFQYTFVCGGAVLAMANVLYIIARKERWTKGAVLRVIFNFLIALGLGLVACVSQNTMGFFNYHTSTWILPTFVFAYLLVFIVNHLTEERRMVSVIAGGLRKGKRQIMPLKRRSKAKENMREADEERHKSASTTNSIAVVATASP
ncbi:hypothetical protein D7B24_005542 [Verticillium nonalfalfae]|uniref:Uncharacterized protein n=1 Tax=Verticillium nonalfalfae TaxID=1051616 RepID=A0A3M9YF60_9PEZI|nr:uncharacterized protein D7B24_005542 [Verticillium nonalfalfae]RNJ57750.1 hypothetical protein D7B24_005542 [Verticillium nonalfalfae]